MCRSSSQTYELYLLDCVGRGLQVGFSAASVYWAPWVAGLWTSSGLWVTRCRWVSLNPNLNPWVVSFSLDCSTVVFVRLSLFWKLCSSAPPFEIRQPWLRVDLSSSTRHGNTLYTHASMSFPAFQYSITHILIVGNLSGHTTSISIKLTTRV